MNYTIYLKIFHLFLKKSLQKISSFVEFNVIYIFIYYNFFGDNMKNDEISVLLKDLIIKIRSIKNDLEYKRL